MPDLLIISPNAAVDRTAIIPNYTLGKIHRPQQLVALAGGKGLNVGRAVQRLGGAAHVFTILAGHRGRWMMEQMQAEGVAMSAVWDEGETRDCYSVIDPISGLVTEVFEHAVPISPHTWQAFEALILEHLTAAKMLACSGNLPPGAPPDGYARLIHAAKQAGLLTFADTYGEPLRHALQAQPHVLKINGIETGGLLGTNIETPQDALKAALCLRGMGIPMVIITLGKNGAVGVDDSGGWQIISPQVQTVSATGSGDCFLAGMMVALRRGAAFPAALQLAAGAATANVLLPGAGIFDPAAAREMAEQVQITPV